MPNDRDDLEVVEALVEVELPEAVVEDVREATGGDLDRDEISDRLIIVPTVNGEPV